MGATEGAPQATVNALFGRSSEPIANATLIGRHAALPGKLAALRAARCAFRSSEPEKLSTFRPWKIQRRQLVQSWYFLSDFALRPVSRQEEWAEHTLAGRTGSHIRHGARRISNRIGFARPEARRQLHGGPSVVAHDMTIAAVRGGSDTVVQPQASGCCSHAMLKEPAASRLNSASVLVPTLAAIIHVVVPVWTEMTRRLLPRASCWQRGRLAVVAADPGRFEAAQQRRTKLPKSDGMDSGGTFSANGSGPSNAFSTSAITLTEI